MLLDRSERQDRNTVGTDSLGDLRPTEFGEMSYGSDHDIRLAMVNDGVMTDGVTAGQQGMPARQSPDRPTYDAVVIGAGHNGLVCAAYLARAGARTLLIEARDRVGGTAASEPFGSATVNICNCDHLTLRTTPVIDELGLAHHGLRYLDVDPAQINISWTHGGEWALYHDVERTIDELRATHPNEVAAYQRYLRVARPMVEMILGAANEVPTRRALIRAALRRRFAGIPHLLLWSRRSAADILRSYFDHEALRATAAVTGPMVWGISPEFRGSGLGALTHAMRHVAQVGRPVGGSGSVTDALRDAFVASGGTLRTGIAAQRILCDGERVRGVGLSDQTTIETSVVISACDPRRTVVEWLRDPPHSAIDLIDRWRSRVPEHGYESKIDAIVREVPRLAASGRLPGPTTVIAPDLAEIDRGYHLMRDQRILERPAILVNVPSIDDPSVRTPQGHHVLSIEALFTPYGFSGGWTDTAEPQRWLRALATVFHEPLDDNIIEWRAVTPDVYERDFHLPHGHATSFAGGPLAVFRSSDPELTSYETSIPGLFLTGAATFPGAGVWGASGRNCASVVLESTALAP
jgi:beta-carotene ketolase (CrtO type)